jgi:hypothetical protein
MTILRNYFLIWRMRYVSCTFPLLVATCYCYYSVYRCYMWLPVELLLFLLYVVFYGLPCGCMHTSVTVKISHIKVALCNFCYYYRYWHKTHSFELEYRKHFRQMLAIRKLIETWSIVIWRRILSRNNLRR